jgi:hypothetical protein
MSCESIRRAFVQKTAVVFMILAFFPVSMMPSFQSLPDDRKKSLVEYLKSLKLREEIFRRTIVMKRACAACSFFMLLSVSGWKGFEKDTFHLLCEREVVLFYIKEQTHE